MNKTHQTLRYLLKGFIPMTVIACLSILGNVTFTNLIYHLTDPYDGTRQVVPLTIHVEGTAAMFALLIGMLLLLANLKVVLANGVSRKTFILTSLPAAGVMAAALAIFNVTVVLVHGLFWPAVLGTQLAYPGIGWVGLLLVQFALYFLAMVVGWFITLAYYRGSTAVRWAISLAPFLLVGLYLTANAQTGGAIAAAVGDFWRFTMRSDPAIAVITLLAYTAIFYGVVYLLIRRAPIKS